MVKQIFCHKCGKSLKMKVKDETDITGMVLTFATCPRCGNKRTVKPASILKQEFGMAVK